MRLRSSGVVADDHLLKLFRQLESAGLLVFQRLHQPDGRPRFIQRDQPAPAKVHADDGDVALRRSRIPQDAFVVRQRWRSFW